MGRAPRGNGTQHIFEEDPSVFYISFHQNPSPCYPDPGRASETGNGKGRLVLVLEGGYNLKALGESVQTHMQVLMEMEVF